MAEYEQDKSQVQRAPTASAPTSTSGAGAMHETRVNVTRHRRAAMRKESGENAAGPQVDIPETGGRQLPGGVQKTMEKKLGADLSGVKIHTGGDSAGASEKLNARAFTVGNDVHFNAGQFDPGSKEGTKLLAHELTHVVQGQKGGVQKKEDEGAEADAEGKDGEALEVSDPNEPAEQEADAVADQATADMGEGGAKAESKGAEDVEAANDVAGPEGKKDEEEEGAPAETQEAAPEAGTKTKISAKLHASAARKLLRKTVFRDEEKKDVEAETAPSAEGAEAAAPEGDDASAAATPPEGDAKAEAASPEAASAEANAEAPEAAAPETEAKPEENKSVAAKLKGVYRKIFRAGGGDPETEWRTFCDSLPLDDVKAPAKSLQPDEREPFRQVGIAYYRAFLKLQTKAARIEFPTLDRNGKEKMLALTATDTHRNMYESTLAGAARSEYRGLTPDERRDFERETPAKITEILTDAVKLQEWRNLRSLDALRANPELAAGLAAAGENPEQIVTELSKGSGGERMRRVISDPGWANPGDKIGFIQAVKSKMTEAGGDVMKAMDLARPAFIMKGKLASGDAKFMTMPILKAVPLLNIAKFGTVPDSIILDIGNANLANPALADCKKADGTLDRDKWLAKAKERSFKTSTFATMFAAHARAAGSVAGCDANILGGGGVPSAYYTYDPVGLTILNPDMSGGDVAKLLAVEESGEYQSGFAVVQLPDAVKTDLAASKNIRRPTAVDGLWFDQFAVAPADECFGVTSGQVGEVVVGSVSLSQTTVQRVV